ncbi:MAG: alpha/beta hydrolase fold domain-containing protein [Micromonosporaceae bacterium]|nr:alpha/beta hydrolase fold domain-containing protein [Micromonosporaceae bacterium]
MAAKVVVQLRTEVSREARMAHLLAQMFVKPVVATWPMTSWGIRVANFLERALLQRPAPRWATVEPVLFDGFEAEWVRADNAADDGAVLYFHGGAFMVCGPGTHRPAVARISRAGGLPALSVEYRQLPAAPLAGSVADCLTAYRWLLDEGYDPQRIVFAGDSAGGQLAFTTALRAVAEGLPRPGGLVAISPWLDLDCETKLTHPNSRRDAYAPAKRLRPLVKLLVEDAAAVDPLLSPVNCDLSALPPALLIAAEGEMLRCDSELMAERLAAAGVPCVLQLWEGQMHAFPIMVGLFPEAGQAIREVGAFVRRRVAASVPSLREAS